MVANVIPTWTVLPSNTPCRATASLHCWQSDHHGARPCARGISSRPELKRLQSHLLATMNHSSAQGVPDLCDQCCQQLIGVGSQGPLHLDGHEIPTVLAQRCRSLFPVHPLQSLCLRLWLEPVWGSEDVGPLVGLSPCDQRDGASGVEVVHGCEHPCPFLSGVLCVHQGKPGGDHDYLLQHGVHLGNHLR